MQIIGKGKSSSGKSANALISDGSDRTFMADVIDASREATIVVDFWAPWCGPCRQLGPALEKAVTEAGGKVKLVKIDIDQNPAVAGQMGVRSIPAVVAFRDGRPIDGFMGALPESQVKAFITKVAGGGAPDAPSVPDMLAAADEVLAEGDVAGAAEVFAAVLEMEPENQAALAGMARCYLAAGEVERARAVIELVPAADRRKAPVAAVLAAIELAEQAAEPDEIRALSQAVEAAPENPDARFELATALAGLGRHDEAADHLLKILEKDLTWKEGAAREQLLKIFEAAGPVADVTKQGRRRLSALLFK